MVHCHRSSVTGNRAIYWQIMCGDVLHRRFIDSSEYSGSVLFQSSQSSMLQSNAIAIDAGSLIVYFDNSYSWFKEKRIKYFVS